MYEMELGLFLKQSKRAGQKVLLKTPRTRLQAANFRCLKRTSSEQMIRQKDGDERGVGQRRQPKTGIEVDRMAEQLQLKRFRFGAFAMAKRGEATDRVWEIVPKPNYRGLRL